MEPQSEKVMIGNGLRMRGGALARLVLAAGLALCVAESRAADAPGLRYRARIEGVPDSGLRDVLKQVSGLITRADQRPPSRSALERRAQEDEKDLRRVLESEGYYDSSIHVRF